MTETKKCPKCISKPLSEFYKNASRKDGLQYICKVCSIASTAAYKKTDAGKAAKAKYAKTDASKACQAKYQVRYRKTKAGKLSQIKSIVKYKSANPVKIKAKAAINNAIRDGRMERPAACSECPSTSNIQGHHDDYALPLVVRWLCQLCHGAWHKENGPGLNG